MSRGKEAFDQRTASGLYLVTLNTDEYISVNAHDQRIAHRAVKVRRGNIKVGKAADLAARNRNYTKTFGLENVNCHVLAYLPGGKPGLALAKSMVLKSLRPFRIRGRTGRLNEWLDGVAESCVRKMVLEALNRSGIEHVAVASGAFTRESAMANPT